MREWREEVERLLTAARLDGAAAHDVAEELAQHLEDRYEELCASGVEPPDARARVLNELGEGDQLARRLDTVLRARPEPLPIGRTTLGGSLDGARADLRLAARMLVRTPIYALIAIAVMALGIGANTVIFIVVNSVLLQPPAGVVASERLAAIYTSDYSGPRFGSTSYPDLMALRDTGEVFEEVTAYALQTLSITGDGWSARGMGEFVSDNYFRALGVQPAAGRFFTADEADLGVTASVAVIGDDLWQEQFGGSSDAIGSRILVKGEPLAVIGVTPREFGGSLNGLRSQLWLPLSAPRALIGVDVSHRGNRGLRVIARLRDAVTIEAAQQRLDLVASRLHDEFPDEWTDVNEQSRLFTIVPESEARVPRGMRAAVIGFLGMLMAAVFCVLLIACTNVANMMLTRATSRRAEIGVRLALGATRGRIVRHLLAESMLLSLVGGAAGLLLAIWLTGLLNAFRLPGLHVTVQVGLDAYVLLFAMSITLATGVLFGLAPALHASRAPAPLLRDGSGVARRRLRDALVIVQVAASVVLLVGGGLFLRTLRAAHSAETGYVTDNVVVAPFDLDVEGWEPQQAAAFYEQLLERANALPGVTSSTLAREVPLALGWTRRSVTVQGYRPAEGEDMEIPLNGVAPGYFRTMGVQLRRGRDFSVTDRLGAPPVIIVSEAFVRRFWADGDALGERVSLDGAGGPFAEVIAVAPDAKYRSLDDEPQPYFYYPYQQRPAVSMALLARTAGDAGSLAAALRAEIRALEPSLPPTSVYTFRQHLMLATLPQGAAALLLGGLGLLAAGIAVIGLYGIVAFGVAQRAREFGIRMALGAVAADVRRLVFGEALRLVTIGIACGVPIAIIAALAIRSLLMVQPIDPVAFLSVPTLLTLSALLASYLPARRATAQDPASTLRAE